MESVPGRAGPTTGNRPRPVLESPVTGSSLVALAETLRRRSCGSLDLLAAELGATVRVGRLAAAVGGSQARLLSGPRGFDVTIDPDPAPGEPDGPADQEARRRFRLAHELGHLLFFAASPPYLRVRRPEPHEEEFCDRLAALLLVPPARTEGLDASELVELAGALHAPVGAVLLSAALAERPAAFAVGRWRAASVRGLRRCGPRSGRQRLSATALRRYLTPLALEEDGPFLVLIRRRQWSSTLLQHEPALLL